MADAFKALLELPEVKEHVFTSFDPNIRDKMIPDAKAYAELMESWIPLFDMIKISKADLAFLTGEEEGAIDLKAIADRWFALDNGPSLVVVTRGGRGSVAYRPGGAEITVALDPVTVVDAVGASDSVYNYIRIPRCVWIP